MDLKLYSQAYGLMSDKEKHIFSMTTNPRAIVLLKDEPQYQEKLDFIKMFPRVDDAEFFEEYGCLTSDYVYNYYELT